MGPLAAATAALAAAALSLAPPPATAAVRAPRATAAKPPAGYTPIKTGPGMCLDDTGGIGRSGQPVQVWKCLGNVNQAWRAEPDGTIRNADGYCLGTGTAANHYAGTGNGTRVVLVSCSASALGSYWTVSAVAPQIVNKYATAALDNRYNVQHDGNSVELWDPSDGSPQAKEWTAVPSGGGAPVVTPGKAPALHVDHANMVTAAGQVFVPRGFTLSTLEFSQPYLDAAGAYTSVLAETEAEIDAAAGAWHGNIVRLQVEQDTLVQDEAAGDDSYLDLIRSVVSDAKAKGLVVVLNAQTEQVGLEPLPTQATVEFWHLLQPYYGSDRSVIIDVFNEPRPLTGTTVAQYMSLWRNGGEYQGVSYLGHEQLAKTLRDGGYASNTLWVEPPGNDGLAGLTQSAAVPASSSPSAGPSQPAVSVRQSLALAGVEREAALKATADPVTFLLSGVSNVSYSFHHPTVLGTARTPANWDAQFGDLGRAVRRPGQGARAVGRRRRVGNPGRVHRLPCRQWRQRPVLERRPDRGAALPHLPAAAGRGHDGVDAERRRARHRHHRWVGPGYLHHHRHHGPLARVRERHPGGRPGGAADGVVRPAGGLAFPRPGTAQLESPELKKEAKLPATAVTTKIAHISSATSTIFPAALTGLVSDEETDSSCTAVKKTESPKPLMPPPFLPLSNTQIRTEPTARTTSVAATAMMRRATSRR